MTWDAMQGLVATCFPRILRMISIGRLINRSNFSRRLTTRGFTRLGGIHGEEVACESKGVVAQGKKKEVVAEEKKEVVKQWDLVSSVYGTGLQARLLQSQQLSARSEAGKVVHGYVDASWSPAYNSYFLAAVFLREEPDQGTTRPFMARVIRRSGSEKVPPYKNIYSDYLHGSHDAELTSGVEGAKFFLSNLVDTKSAEPAEKNCLILHIDNRGAYSLLKDAAEEASDVYNPQASWTDRMLYEFRSSIVKVGVPVFMTLITRMQAHRFANFRFSADEMRFGPDDILRMEEFQMFRCKKNRGFLVYFDNLGKIGMIVDSIASIDITETVIKSHGGFPGKYEIIDALPDSEQVAKALQKLGLDAEIKTILINLNGGGTSESSKALAHRIIYSAFLAQPKVPVFVNFFGKELNEAKLVLKKNGMIASKNLDDAVLKSLDAMRAAGK